MNDIIFYSVESMNHTVDDLVDSFYPEFACDERKRPAIKAAILAMNRHLGMNEFGSLAFLSWVVMPDYNSSVYSRLYDNNNPDPFHVSWDAQCQLSGIPSISANSHIHYAMREIGPAKMLAISNFAHDWWGGFKENLAESPLKDSISESSKYFMEKIGEHGAEVFMATRSLDSALKKFSSVSGKEARQLAKSEVLNAHNKLSHELPKAVKSLVNHYSHKTHMRPSNYRGLRAINNAGNALRSADKLSKSKSFVISSSKYTKMIKVMKYGKYVGKGLIVLDIVTNTVDVVHSYEKGEDWKKLAIEDSCEFFGGIAGASLGGMEGIISGPAAIIVSPVLAIGGAISVGKAAKSFCTVEYNRL